MPIECDPEPATSEIMCIDDTELTVRRIEALDVDRLARMFGRISRESVYRRFLSPIPSLPRPMLLRLSDVDHCRREALVALDGDEIVAEARYDTASGDGAESPDEAEFAVTVDDVWQRRGVGYSLSARLARLAKARGFARFNATMLADNRAAIGLARKLSPDATFNLSHGEYEARMPLTDAAAQLEGDPLSTVE